MNSSRGRGGNGCVTRMARYHRGLEINPLLPMSWRLPTLALALCALLAPVSAAPAQGGGVALVAAVVPDAGLDAATLIADAARTVGGGGGKGAELAVAGGRDASRIDEALDQARAAAGLG